MAAENRRPTQAMVRFDPYRELQHMERELDREFHGPFRELLGWPMMWARGMTKGMYAPYVDLVDKGDHYLVKAELPGLRKEDIDVSISENVLTISGEWKRDEHDKEEDYVLRERFYGSFHREVGLPSTVDATKVKASYDNGVLEISIPKTAEAKAKKIPVSIRETEKKPGPVTHRP